MNTPLVAWACIVGLFLLVFAVRFAKLFSFNAKGGHRFIEWGSEAEEFFVPGDAETLGDEKPEPKNDDKD